MVDVASLAASARSAKESLAANTLGRLTPRRAAFGAFVVAGWLVLLAAYGFLPGQSQVPLTALIGTGAIQCLHDQGISSLWSWCMSLGLPVGAPRLTGLPQVYTGWVLSYFPGIDAWAAHQITKAVFVTFAIFGSYRILRRWEIGRWIAFPATIAYFLAPNVIVLNGYPYTFVGYLLLPAFVWLALIGLDQLDAGRPGRAIAIAAITSLVMVFTDGYAFFCWALVVGCFVAVWAIGRVRSGHVKRGILGAAVWLTSLAGSAMTYAVWVPGDGYSTDVPFEYFGLLAVDVVTLLVPSSHFLWPQLLGIDPPDLDIWGIADTPPANYLGYLALALTLTFLILGRVRRGTRPRAELVILAVVGVCALVLSLGPTLKVGQVDPGLENSIATLPTAWLYETVPGLSDMRATNRWLIVTRWVVIVLGAAGLNELSRRAAQRGPLVTGAVVVIGVLAMVEIAPNVSSIVRKREESIALVTDINEGVVREAGTFLDRGETVLILPSANDFLASYLVPMLGLRSYNVGGDKNYALSFAQWPQAVRDARDNYGPESAGYLCTVLDGYADAIVLPLVDPYSSVLLREQDPDSALYLEQVATTLAQDQRFTAEIGEQVVVLRSSGQPCD